MSVLFLLHENTNGVVSSRGVVSFFGISLPKQMNYGYSLDISCQFCSFRSFFYPSCRLLNLLTLFVSNNVYENFSSCKHIYQHLKRLANICFFIDSINITEKECVENVQLGHRVINFTCYQLYFYDRCLSLVQVIWESF